MDKRSRELFHGIVDLFFMATGNTPWNWAPDVQETVAATVLVDPIGQPICLGDLRGRVIVLCFWRASSPQCRENIAALERLAAEVGDLADRVKFAPVSIRTREYGDDVGWLRQSGSMHSTHRWEDRSGEQVRVFFKGQWSWKIPNTLLIAPDGDIADRTCGTVIDVSSNPQTIRNLLTPADAAA